MYLLGPIAVAGVQHGLPTAATQTELGAGQSVAQEHNLHGVLKIIWMR